jgi:transmembrane sensor
MDHKFKNKMDSFPIDKIIASFEDQLSGGEQKELELWLSESAENQNKYDELRKVVKLSDQVKVDFQPDECKALQKVNRTIYIKRFVRRAKMSAAAVLLLFFIAKGITTISPVIKWNEVIAKEKQVIYLPDSTKVILANTTSIKYPEVFDIKERHVILKGQAYFEVKPNSNQPFMIATSNAGIMVLGTRFFVDAASSNKQFVAVDEGTVAFYSIGSKEQTILSVNEVGEWDSMSNQITKRKNPNSNQNAWLSGRLIFNSATLVTIIKDLEKLYHVKIQFSGQKFETMQFTAQFLFEDGIDEILRLFSQMGVFSIEKKGNLYVLTAIDDYSVKTFQF